MGRGDKYRKYGETEFNKFDEFLGKLLSVTSEYITNGRVTS